MSRENDTAALAFGARFKICFSTARHVPGMTFVDVEWRNVQENVIVVVSYLLAGFTAVRETRTGRL